MFSNKFKLILPLTLLATLIVGCDVDEHGLEGEIPDDVNAVWTGFSVTAPEAAPLGVVYLVVEGEDPETTDDDRMCAGTMLSNDLVMTARNCVSELSIEGQSTFVWGADRDIASIYVGTGIDVVDYSQDLVATGEQARPAALRHYDPSEDSSSSLTAMDAYHSDVSILELATPLWPLGENVPFMNDIWGSGFASYQDMTDYIADGGNINIWCYGYGTYRSRRVYTPGVGFEWVYDTGKLHKALMPLANVYVDEQYSMFLSSNYFGQSLVKSDQGGACFVNGKPMWVTGLGVTGSNTRFGAIPPENWIRETYFPHTGVITTSLVMAGFENYPDFTNGGDLKIKLTPDFAFDQMETEFFWRTDISSSSGNEFNLPPAGLFSEAYEEYSNSGSGDFDEWQLDRLEYSELTGPVVLQDIEVEMEVEEAPDTAFCRATSSGSGLTKWTSGDTNNRKFEMDNIKVHCIEKKLATVTSML